MAQTVFDPSGAHFADLFKALVPLRNFSHELTELRLEAAYHGPAKCVNRVAMNDRTAIGAARDLILGDVGKGNAGDALISLGKGRSPRRDQKFQRLNQGVGLARTGPCLQLETLSCDDALFDLLKSNLAGLFRRAKLDYFSLHRQLPPQDSQRQFRQRRRQAEQSRPAAIRALGKATEGHPGRSGESPSLDRRLRR